MSFAAGASLETLRRRAAVVAAIRGFFAARGVLEVETPALSAAGVSDLNIESITARAASLGGHGQTLYLHTSPEYAMKRLLAAGSGDIYQMCRVFRDDELGRWHEPEFTLLEWYRVGFTENELMDEVAALFAEILPTRAVRVRYADAYREALGCDVARDSPAAVAGRIAAAGIDVPPDLPHGALLDLGFAAAVAPRFDAGVVTFVHDFPPSQAALARIKPGPPPVAARFEAFYAGLELANGFAELNDAREQTRRFHAELAARRAAGRPTPPLDATFLAAVGALPDCAGVAVGVDRLVAAALGASELAAVLAFTHRPQA